MGKLANVKINKWENAKIEDIQIYQMMLIFSVANYFPIC
jgi:hypothetical protein